jgi:CheY-like chemotaxis protein
LIVENDQGFARLLLEAARENGFKGLSTSLGAAALGMAREYQPDAITLDMHLPDMDGWRVLDRLKNNLATRHIPVCVISTDDARDRALLAGARLFAAKPLQSRDLLDDLLQHLRDYISRPVKTLLVLEQDVDHRIELVDSVAGEDVEIVAVADAAAAARVVDERDVDCMIVGEHGDELIERFAERQTFLPFSRLPLIVRAERHLAGKEAHWKRLSETCTVRFAHTPERLLELTVCFLHRSPDKMTQPMRQLLEQLHASQEVLVGKTALLVDDDVRNIFALSAVLEEHEMTIVSADNGRDAIRILSDQDQTIDIVLMDIMMPEMDGIETIREIRKIPELKHLPIIAVTAKAMKGDREKCIQAGAWDYLSKPVDTQQMLAAVRAWLEVKPDPSPRERPVLNAVDVP